MSSEEEIEPISKEQRDVLIKELRMEVHLLREELSGVREMLEGAIKSINGAQKAYASVAQRADLLSAKLQRVEGGGGLF